MNELMEIDIREVGQILWKKIWILLLCAVLVAGMVLVYTVNFVTPMYTASITVYVNNNSSQNNLAISSGDLAVALRLVNTYINILGSDQVLEEVIKKTGAVLTPGQLRAMISAEAMGETEMFEVKVETPSPELSQDLANAIAEIAPGKISTVIEGSSAKVVDYAKLPTSKSSPNYVKNAVLGFALGLIGAAAFVVCWSVMDTRVKCERDLMRIQQLPILGKIPDIGAVTEQKPKKVRR